MGGGAGVIIVESLRVLGETSLVRAAANAERLDKILAKSNRDWTKPDMQYVNNCVSKAIKKL